jgi:TonB family protein
MAFDPSTLLSRTGAGDAELRTPQNGLSLAQRKLLTLLERPQALEEFAAAHGIDPERLERDLAKLVALNLVAVNGETAATESTTVVLGGLRAPSSLLRLAFIPALVVAGAIAYFVVMPLIASRPAPAAPTPVLASSPPVAGAATPAEPRPAPVPTAAPIVVPLQVPPAAPPPAAAHTAPVPPPAAAPPAVAAIAAEPKTTRTPAAVVTAEPKPLAVAADLRHDEPARPVVAADAAKLAAAAKPIAVETASPLPQAAPAKVAALPVAPAPAQAAATPVHATPHTAEPAPAAVKPATPAARPAAGEPTTLAMAASSAADAHPPAKVKLLPVARQDPEFPREAFVRGVTHGDVKARLSIDGGGKVTAVDIVEARPARVFDRAVRDALSHWTFPAGAGGRSTEVEIAFHRD